MAVLPFRTPYAAGFFRAARPKHFTPSMAFARSYQARLPVGPLQGNLLRRGRFHFMLRTGGLHPPREGLTPRFDAPVSPYAGGLLQRRLGPSFDRTLTGELS